MTRRFRLVRTASHSLTPVWNRIVPVKSGLLRQLPTISAACILSISTCPPTLAGPFTAGNIITTEQSRVVEYTREGLLVQSINIPASGDARDLIMDEQGRVHVFNGTFNPVLSTYDPALDVWSSHSFAGWNVGNNSTVGAIGAFQNYVFVQDTSLNSKDPGGIVRFDTTNFAAQRFHEGSAGHVRVGGDGLLYAMQENRTIVVYDPLTMQQLRSFGAGDVSTRDFAVNGAGQVFTVNLRGLTRRLSASGTVEASVQIGGGGTFGGNIDVAADGTIIIGGVTGQIYVTDELFSSVRSFPRSSSFGYVAFATSGSTPAETVTLVERNASWRFLDDGSNPGVDWRIIGFVDAAWKTGQAELGYGDGDEATVVNCGPSAPTCNANNYATTYFRHVFDVADPNAIQSVFAQLTRDDAAAIYLNGQEIYRDSNLAANAAFNTFATATSAENALAGFSIDPSVLVRGPNLLAVEVHQAAATSSDISFALELRAVVPEPTTSVLAIVGTFLACVSRRRFGR